MSKIKPTTAELDILNILWVSGPSTVRQVHEQLAETKDVFYTTTLKTMQVMHSKGLLDRDTSERSHRYKAIIRRQDVEKSLLDSLRSTLFSGSTSQLVISALGHGKPTSEELEEIRSIIDKLEDND